MFYIFSNTRSRALGLVPADPASGRTWRYMRGHGADPNAPPPASAGGGGGGGEGGGGLTVQGLPLIKPPYGRITAIDLNKGEIVWQIAHGETPDNIRNHPALKGADHSAHRPPGPHRHAGDQDAGDRRRRRLVHARRTGSAARCCARTTRRPAQEVGAVYMPAPQTGSPMTYMLNGKQYIVVAISGRTFRAS